jgi:hypothetical protein
MAIVLVEECRKSASEARFFTSIQVLTSSGQAHELAQ